METSQLLASSSTFFNLSNSLSRKQKKKKKKKKQHHLQLGKHTTIHQNNTTSISYYPKALQFPQTPFTQTKLQALDALLQDLQSSINRGISIDTHIFSSLLETCFRLQSLNHGIQVHNLIPHSLLRKNSGLSSKLLRLYASLGLIQDAHQLFDEMPKRNESTFAWNSLISGYTELGQYEEAMALYFQLQEEGVAPDNFTFPRVLKACAGLGSIRIGEAIHRDIVRAGFGIDGFVLNALVDMYAKCGDIVKARLIFDKIGVRRDAVSWNSMLTGYVHHGLLHEALGIFRRMVGSGFEPDYIAVSVILSRFSSSRIGFEVHGWVLRRGLEENLSIGNSLILVYCEQGKLDHAGWAFENMPERDVVSWNSIISGHGKDPRALGYFWEMENCGASPNGITFVLLLSACARLGLVEDGKRLFVKMKEKYGIRPGMEHYGCMVNLLGRAGLIDEAYEIIVRMEFEAGPTVWGALLFACSLHVNVNIGEIAAKKLFELEPDNEHNFELMIKIYGMAGRWKEVEKVMRLMGERGLDS